MAEYKDFEKLDIRTGKIVGVEEFPEAKKPSYKLKIDLGVFGIKNSSVQIVKNYSKTTKFSSKQHKKVSKKRNCQNQVSDKFLIFFMWRSQDIMRGIKNSDFLFFLNFFQ